MNQLSTFLTTRHATVADLAALLQTQHTAKVDVVTPAGHVIAEMVGCASSASVSPA